MSAKGENVMNKYWIISGGGWKEIAPNKSETLSSLDIETLDAISALWILEITLAELNDSNPLQDDHWQNASALFLSTPQTYPQSGWGRGYHILSEGGEKGKEKKR